MAEAKAEAEWDHTASLMALLAEINRDREQRRRPFTPQEFHPMHQQQRKRRRLSDREVESALCALAGKKRPKKPGLWDTIRNGNKPA